VESKTQGHTQIHPTRAANPEFPPSTFSETTATARPSRTAAITQTKYAFRLAPSSPLHFKQQLGNSLLAAGARAPRSAPRALPAHHPMLAPPIPNHRRNTIAVTPARIIKRFRRGIFGKRLRRFLKLGQCRVVWQQFQPPFFPGAFRQPPGILSVFPHSPKPDKARAIPLVPSLSLVFFYFLTLPAIVQSLPLAAQEIRRQHRELFFAQEANARGPERQQILHLRAGKRPAFGGRLNFHVIPAARHDQIHIHFGARVFLIAQIQQRTSSTIPTLVAATESISGEVFNIPAATMRSIARASARTRR